MTEWDCDAVLFDATTHPRAELKWADVTAAQLADVQISPGDMRPVGRLSVRITEA